MPAVSVVSFDADGTLWDFVGVMRRSLGLCLDRMAGRWGSLPATTTVDSLIGIRDEVAAAHRGEGLTHEAVRHLAFAESLRRCGHDDEAFAAELAELYLHHRFADIALFPDVAPTLDRLRDRYRLALLTNGNCYPERCGLPGTFDAVVLSQDHGVDKPDRRLYEALFAELGCAPAEVLHIGDSLVDDYHGANTAGAVGAWLNRDGAPVPPDCERHAPDLPGCLAWLV